jgi:hypothetical protein
LVTIDNQGSQVEVPERIGVPAGVLYAKVGLPGGFDLGTKAGGFDYKKDEGDASFDFKTKIYGVELRKRLLGGSGVSGAALPDLSLAVAYDRATGHLDTTDHYSGPLKGGQTLDADLIGKTDWNVGAVSARLLLSKTVLIFTPYAGVGVTKHTGKARTSLSTVGTLTSVGPVNETVGADSDANDSYGSLTVGGEVAFFPFFRVNLGAMFAKDKTAAGLGVNFRFR